MLFELGTLEIGVEADIAKFKSAMDETVAKTQKTTRSITKSLRGVKNVGRDLVTSLTLPAGGIFAGIVNEGRKFETTMVGIRKTTNLSVKETDELGKSIRKLAKKDLPLGVNELGNITEAAGQLGVKGKRDLLAFTDTVAKLGQASDLHGAEAAKTLARLLTVTGETSDQVDVLGSVIVRLGNNFAATESEIAEMATRVAQATAAYSVSSAEASAMGAALKAVGVNAESGGTQVGKTMRSIELAILSGGKKLREFSEITGIAADDLKSAFDENATDVFVRFIGGLKRVKDAGGSVTETLSELGLKNDRILAVLPSLVTGYDGLTSAISHANDETINTNALNEEAAKAFSTFSTRLDRLKASFVDLGIAFAQSGLLEGVGSFVTGLAGLVSTLGELSPTTLKYTGILLGVAAVLGPLLLTFGQLGIAIRGLIGLKGLAAAAASGFAARLGAVAATSGVASASLGVLRGAFAVLGGPAGVIALVVTALAFYISKSSEARNANLEFIRSINMTRETQDLNASLERTASIISTLESELVSAKTALDKAIGRGATGITGLNTAALAARDNIKKLEGQLVEARKASINISDQIEEQKKLTDSLSKSNLGFSKTSLDFTKSVHSSTGAISENAEAHGQLSNELKKTNQNLGESVKQFGDYSTAAELVTATVKKNNSESKKSKNIQAELDRQLQNLDLTTEEYQKAVESLGLQSTKTTNLMESSWENFSKGAFGSVKGFVRSTLDSFSGIGDGFKDLGKNLLDLAKDIVSDLISTFASNALKNVFKDLFKGVSGGPSGADNKGGLISAALSAIGVSPSSIASSVGAALGLTSAVGAGSAIVATGATTAALASGSAAAALATVPTTVLPASFATAGGATAAAGGATGAGFFASIGTTISTGLQAVGSAISGAYTAVIGALGPVGAAVAAIAAVASLVGSGARSFDEIVKEDYLPDLLGINAGSALGASGETGFNGGNTGIFGANFGIQGTGITSQLLVDGGENGNGGFFNGAIKNLEEFGELLRQNGIEVEIAHGTLRALSRDNSKTAEDIKNLWQEYANGITKAVEFTDVYKTAVENNLIKTDNLFFENFALGFGQSAFEARDAIIAIDKSFDSLVASGETATSALLTSFSQFYGITDQQSRDFFERSGTSIEKWASNFRSASGDSLRELLDFNADGVTAFENLSTSGIVSAETIGQSFRTNISGLRGIVDTQISDSQTQIDRLLGSARSRAEAANDQIVSELRVLRKSVEAADHRNVSAASEVQEQVRRQASSIGADRQPFGR